MRTFLVALVRKTVDCREAKGASWAGRSPLLGSIAMCRPPSSMTSIGLEKSSARTLPVAHFKQTSEIPASSCPQPTDSHHHITHQQIVNDQIIAL